MNKNNKQELTKKGKFSILNSQFSTRSNSGFSLIELIIVIAIMAILIAVLAPIFLRYIERSRQATDADAVGNMLSALQVSAVDTKINEAPPPEYTLYWYSGIDGEIVVDPIEYQPSVRETVGEFYNARSNAARSTDYIEISINIFTGKRIAASPDMDLSSEQNQYFMELLQKIEQNND